jgi:uncharacterized RmlC-like cupin family protein
MESGPGGSDAVEAGPGDFLSVPPRVVHREISPDSPVHAVVVRVGEGQIVVNVEGPDPE